VSILTETEEFINNELLDSIFIYNKEKGSLIWKVTTSTKHKQGTIVGYLNDGGYLAFTLFGNVYLVHRIIWKIENKTFPIEYIDHIDRDRTNNRITNLREATMQQNNFNRTRKDNSTGYTGVALDKRCGKYRAYINIKGKQKSLGYYFTAYDASLAREAAAKELHGEFYNEGVSIS
jgi:hypothetical protein